VGLQRVRDPVALRAGPRALPARAALQEEQPGQVVAGAVGCDHLAREHVDAGSVGVVVVQRYGEGVVGVREARYVDHPLTLALRRRTGSTQVG
jgi:hypothetical protein